MLAERCSSTQGPGHQHVQFCMSSLLATLVLDPASMAEIEARGECVKILDSCLNMLSSTMDSILAWPYPITPEEVGALWDTTSRISTRAVQYNQASAGYECCRTPSWSLSAAMCSAATWPS
jgi:hypothetical protein